MVSLFNFATSMNDLKNRTTFTSSVTHSETAISQILEEFSQDGVQSIHRSTLSGADQGDTARHFWRIAVS
ncbi:MAG TPA: hypothetical protein ENJ75_03150 [Candidatus Kaiserbacteria bacterium]|nr:hypothetical protein [Candidatus Kaiserbacteria bacterium]